MQTRKFPLQLTGDRSYPALLITCLVYPHPTQSPPPEDALECEFLLDSGNDEFLVVPAGIISALNLEPITPEQIGISTFSGTTEFRDIYGVSLYNERINLNTNMEAIFTRKSYGLIPMKLIREWKVTINANRDCYYVTTYYDE